MYNWSSVRPTQPTHYIQGRLQRIVFFLGGGGGKFWSRGTNLPPFSIFSLDLGHFILILLNSDTYFSIFYLFLYLFSRFGGQNILSRALEGMARAPGSAYEYILHDDCLSPHAQHHSATYFNFSNSLCPQRSRKVWTSPTPRRRSSALRSSECCRSARSAARGLTRSPAAPACQASPPCATRTPSTPP